MAAEISSSAPKRHRSRPKVAPPRRSRRAEGLVLRAAPAGLCDDHLGTWLDVLGGAVAHGLLVVVITPSSSWSRALDLAASKLTGSGVCRSLQPPDPTDSRTSADGAAAWLWDHGVAPEATLWLTGDLIDLERAVREQLTLRREGQMPVPAMDPLWTVRIDRHDSARERSHASLLALCDGVLGTRGEVAGGRTRGQAAVHMSGVYCAHGTESHLLAGPLWQSLPDGGDERPRTLDLHSGMLHCHGPADEEDAVLFSSAARPGTGVLRCRSGFGDPGPPLHAPPGTRVTTGRTGNVSWMRVGGDPGSIVAAAQQHLLPCARDRIVAYAGAPEAIAPERLAADPARRASRLGFDALLSEHRRVWADRWQDCDVRLAGDPALQRAVRFALFHLQSAAPDSGEAAIGARGLTGSAYRGHVFWDTDAFVLPFLAATRPAAARAVLEYRIRRLPAACRAARAEGTAGAHFPWESAASGREVAPTHVRNARGEIVEVLTGQREEHIVGDVAWSAACYIDWTGDEAFARGPGARLIVETARWWASRIERDTSEGTAHIRGVMGPDEYHAVVDDNAFTNVLAAWNLRRAIGTGMLDARERSAFAELAEALVDGFDPATGLYAQFDGFHELDPLIVADHAPRRPVNAELLLGADAVRRAQVVKQADALMIHYLLPDEARPGSLAPNLDFYEPRTAHGSSLSPGVHAALLARAGRVDDAAAMLALTARIDLDDIGGTTAGGLHLAAMGSVWRALSFGFAGAQPNGAVLGIDPVLAGRWEALELRLRFRDSRIVLCIEPDRMHLRASPPARVTVRGAPPMEIGARPVTMLLERKDLK